VRIVDTISRMAEESSSVVIYSSAFQLARSLSMELSEAADRFTDKLLENLEGKVILMPTFTSGYNSDNFLSLDDAKSNTGIISEIFRLKSEVRTISAFFSFAASGPKVEKLLDLRPEEAWGRGSLYDWIFNQDSLIVTVGLHPTHCSFTHYAEYLAEEEIVYRKKKLFTGIVESKGNTISLEETLLVRHTTPPAKNDFRWLEETYRNAGQILEVVDGVLISGISASRKIASILPFLEKDPAALISNAKEILIDTK
jgi:aminoglycoside N3'-acetyltransferase